MFGGDDDGDGDGDSKGGGDNDDDDEWLNDNGKMIKNLLRWQCIRYLVVGVRLAKLKGNQTIY